MVENTAKTSWVCPKCGRRFAHVNQQHVCETWTLEDHLANTPVVSLKLFERFVELVEACGPFEYSITKANIGFRGQKRIFAGVMPKENEFRGYMDLTHPIDDPRIRNVAPYTKRLFVNHFVVTSEEQLDEEFAGWVCETYAVGQGEHLKT